MFAGTLADMTLDWFNILLDEFITSFETFLILFVPQFVANKLKSP